MPDLDLIIDEETPDLDSMERVQVLSLWDDYRAQLESVKHDAETLTVTDRTQTDFMAHAKTVRLTLKKIRCEVERKRKEIVESAVKFQRKTNEAAKQLTGVIEPLEARMELQENFAALEDAMLREDLRVQRTELLAPYSTDPGLLAGIGNMEAGSFALVLASAKAAHEARQAEDAKAEEASRAAEQAAAEWRTQERAENERLKAEAATREAEITKEREAREHIERQLKAKLDIERATSKAAEDAATKADAAPDKAKIADLARQVRAIAMPSVTTEAAFAVIVKIKEQQGKFATWLDKQSEEVDKQSQEMEHTK